MADELEELVHVRRFVRAHVEVLDAAGAEPFTRRGRPLDREGERPNVFCPLLLKPPQNVKCPWNVPGPFGLAAGSPSSRTEVELAGAQLRDEEIADRLGIASSTVAMLLRSGMSKLGTRSRGDALARLKATGDEQASFESG